jgi:hypothetical protein
MIAKKGEIQKFIKKVDPEKLKEPIRRIWFASKIYFLKSSEMDYSIIESKICEDLCKNGKKIFNFCKENTDFLKKICEKQLNIQITLSLADDIIKNTIELQKFDV